ETVHGMEFILSDETVDRLGDVISADGWDISSFNKNPIALFNHSPNFVIGKWSNLRVEDKALRGHLVLAPKGTSARIDELRKLVDAGILKAVSVGFRSIERKPRKDANDRWIGEHFIKQELVETSLVSVPANPNALAVAKSLRISPETLELVFAKQGNRDGLRRRSGFIGKHAATSRNGKGQAMSLGQRITETEAALVDRRDKLAEHWENADNTNVSDADIEISTNSNAEIAQLEKKLAALTESERLLT